MYGWRLKRIPSHCVCGNTFHLQHARVQKVGLWLYATTIFEIPATANLLTEVCKDVHAELQLQPLSGETFSEKTVPKLDQAGVDFSACGFWMLHFLI